jgi:hypothetical protein
MRSFTAAQNEAAIKMVECPRCEQPCERASLISGICPRCKNNLLSAHGKILKMDYHDAPVGIDRKLREAAHFDENSRRVGSTEDPDTAEQFLHWYCQEFAVNEESAMLQGAAWANHWGDVGVSSMDGIAKARELVQRLVAALAKLIKYDGDKVMFARAIALRLGFYSVAGGQTFVRVARVCSTSEHTVSKQTFLKCFHVVEDAMNLPQYEPLPRLPGQRDEESVIKMQVKQKKIWRNAPKANSLKPLAPPNI